MTPMGSHSPPPAIAALAPGDRLDRYELLCVLAQGGMGTVWLARLSGKHGFERLLAVKTILPMYSTDPQFADMFLDEARIAAGIDHENVARILEIGEDRGVLYYAMELIDGESLRKLYRDVRAREAPFPMGVALRIAADTCAGLHATHELRGPDGALLEIVHRDVSPQNLLVSVRGTTKLIDFGVAKARARNTEETAAGVLKGKIEYMAPEQARGERLDRRADVYSVGAVLYELLAGRPVRDTQEGRQLAALHELMTGAPYQALPPEIPAVVQQVVNGALARDPGRRFPTTEAMRHAIEHAIGVVGEPASTDDVAKVLAYYGRERNEKRREAIERAIKHADDGRVNVTVVAPLAPTQAVTEAIPHVQAPPHDSQKTRHLSPMQLPRAAPHPPMNVPLAPHEPVTGPSMRTMQGASFSAGPTAAASPSVVKVLAALFVLVLVGVLGVTFGILYTRRATAPVAAEPVPVPVATASATATASAEPAPTVPPPVTTTPPAIPTETAAAPTTTATASATSVATTQARDAGGRSAGGAGKARGGSRSRSSSGQKPASADDEYGF